MTKTLRGHRYTQSLDLDDSDMEGFLFKQSADGHGRAAVVWANTRGGATRTIRLDSSEATGVKLIDLFGNVTPLPAGGGVVSLPVELDPIYLTWTTRKITDSVAVLPSPLEVAPAANVMPSGRDTIPVLVRNDTSSPMFAILHVSAGERAGVTVESSEIPVNIEPNSTRTIDVPIDVIEQLDRIDWPQRWTVFSNVAADSFDPTTLTAIPRELSIKGPIVQAQVAHLRDHTLDLAALAGGYRERMESVCIAEIESTKDQTIQAGGSADWWMQWVVNGKQVFSTLETGNNGGQSVVEHQWDVPLKAGKNLIVVRVRSGSKGFKLVTGGPEELAAAAQSAGGASNAISFELRSGESILARQQVRVSRRPVVQPLGALSWEGPASQWEMVDPQADLGEAEIVNEYSKQPDSTKWWQGEKDLSARMWLRADAEFVYVLIAARDDVQKDVDRARAALAFPGGAIVPAELLKSEHIGAETWHWLRVARAGETSNRISLNVQIDDDDFGGLKQTLSWRGPVEGGDTSTWWPPALQ